MVRANSTSVRYTNLESTTFRYGAVLGKLISTWIFQNLHVGKKKFLGGMK